MSLPGINFVVVGSKACGKSTALARLCQQLGGFPEEQHAECRSLAKDMGRPACEHVWMLDASKEERERGSTVEPSRAHFSSSSFSYTAIDTPGDAGLNNNMLSVLSLADVAVLVVSAAQGEFEAGVDSGRTRELALSCFAMGIQKVAVWVTKMDDMSVTNAMARYEEIKKTVSGFLKQVGFKQPDVPFVPISGILGDNLASKSSEMTWYGGKPASDVLDSLGPINRPAEKPLRLPLLKVFEHEDAGTVVVGRVEFGTLRIGIKVSFSGCFYVGEVRSIRKGGETAQEAKSGDIVSVGLGSSVAAEHLHRGMVASNPTSDPAADVETFTAKVSILNHPGSIRAGYCPVMAVHTAQVACEFEELLGLVDRKTGKETKNPDKVKTGDIAVIRMRPRSAACVEAYKQYGSLGRVVIRDHGRTVAIGVVEEENQEKGVSGPKKRPIPQTRTEGGNEYFSS
mmetsp:Transcript_22045/g.55688  ORF Transcript_22045/g.55688 Transcript_22045/m.55688 type:complete len:455 (-) Transcript_22045:60-1424(-)